MAPYPLTAIEGANVLLSAPASAEVGGVAYAWKEWSDGGARVHTVKANAAATYTAVYVEGSGGEEPPGDGGGSGGSGQSPPPAPGGGPPSAASPRVLTSLEKHPGKRTRRDVARFAFAANTSGARFLCKLDEREFTPCSSPRTYRNLAVGTHTFVVTALGAGGAPEPLSKRFSWRVLCLPAGSAAAAIQPRRACTTSAGSAGRSSR